MDVQLGRLVQALRERGLLERSAVVFTADHGEAFGEDELYCAHSEGLDEVLLRVPLLVRAPGVTPAVRSDVVRQIDVAPTLLSLLGLEPRALAGRSLLEDGGDRPLVAQLVLRDQRWRSLRSGERLLVDDDTRALSAADPLGAELERLAPWPVRLSDLVTQEEAEALRAMGYAQ